VVDDNSDEDDDIIQDFVWEDMNNYKGQRENFKGGAGPQGAAKEVTEIVDVFEFFFNSELVDTIVEETNGYAEPSLCGRKLSSRSTARAWKPVTEGEIYVVLGLFMLMGIIQKPTLRSYFTTKRVISTPGFGDIITRERLEQICKFLQCANNETIYSFQETFQNFPCNFTS
jgi:hypothetical protein